MNIRAPTASVKYVLFFLKDTHVGVEHPAKGGAMTCRTGPLPSARKRLSAKSEVMWRNKLLRGTDERLIYFAQSRSQILTMRFITEIKALCKQWMSREEKYTFSLKVQLKMEWNMFRYMFQQALVCDP